MKKIMTSLFVFVAFCLNAQTDCDNNVSTNPASPTNNALPVNLSNNYLNGFNWFPVGQTPGVDEGLLLDYALTNMSFAGTPISIMSNIYSVQQASHYDYIRQGTAPFQENGWELLLVNVGRFPDDVTPVVNGGDFYSMPYIVIYNRYSGIIRVFIRYGLDETVGNHADAIELTIEYTTPEKTSGLMRLYKGNDQALDQATDVIRMTTIVKATPEQRKWYSSDFQIAYDPCTCYYPSQLRVILKQIMTQDLVLHGRSITLSGESLVDNNNVVNALDYLTGFDYTGNDASGGMVMYKSLQGMIDDYKTKLEKYNKELVDINVHNKKVKRNLAVLNMAKAVVSIIGAGGISTNDLLGEQLSGEMAMELAGAQAMGMTEEEIIFAYQGLADVNWFDVVKNEYDDVIDIYNKIDTKKLFAYVKQIFGEQGTTFIANNFEAKALPTAPSKPTASFSEMHYVGQISQSLKKDGPVFYNPGTYGSVGTGSPVVDNPSQYPVYNDVLGTFALLKSPKIKISKGVNPNSVTNDIIQQVQTDPEKNIVDLMRYQTWTKEYQFQLAEDLKYAFNSNLDIKDYTISAAFRIKATKKLLPQTNVSNKPRGVIYSCYIDSTLHSNFRMNNFNFDISDPIEATKSLSHYYQNPVYSNGTNYGYYESNSSGPKLYWGWQPWDDVPATYTWVAPPAHSVTREEIDLITEFVPIDAFYPLVSSVGIKSTARSATQQWFYESGDLSEYEFETVCHPCVTTINNLDHPNVIVPYLASTENDGYEFDLDVELILVVDMEFNTNMKFLNPADNNKNISNKNTQIFKYKIRPQDILHMNNDFIQLGVENSLGNLTQFPKKMVLNTQSLNENTTIEGCKFVHQSTGPNILTCRALETIVINGNLTVNATDPMIVEILAGEEVIVEGESVVGPGIALGVESLLDFSHPMPQVDQQYVTSFCGNVNNPSVYKANAMSKSIEINQNYFDNSTNSKDKINSFFEFSIFPNPSDGNFRLNVSDRSENIQISVFDTIGKEVMFKKINTGLNEYLIELPNPISGIYIVEVVGENGSGTKRIVVK